MRDCFQAKAFLFFAFDLTKCNDAFMKLSKRSLSLVAILFCSAYAAFGDAATDCYNSGIAKRQNGDLDDGVH